MKISKRKIIDHLLLFFTLAISGAPYFSSALLNVPLFILLFTVFLIRKNRLDMIFLVAFAFLIVVTALQTYVFSFFSIQTVLGVFLRLINGYLILKILKTNFAEYFVNTFIIISVISLIFFVPIVLVPGLSDILKQLVPFFQVINFADSPADSLVLYNIHYLSIYRNPGPFWEAGVFGGYLIIAYVFNAFLNLKNKKIKGFIFLLTIISTFSTTAYLAIFFFLFIFFYKKMKNFFLRLFLASLLILLGYQALFNISFLNEKIVNQVQVASEVGDPYKDNTNTQRFLNILRDYEDIKGYEFTGRGSHPQTRYSFDPENQIRTVGLTDILVRMGIPYFLFMMFLLHRSIKYFANFYSHSQALYYNGFFVTVMLVLMSQVYFNFPIFWSLIFLSCSYKSPNLKRI